MELIFSSTHALHYPSNVTDRKMGILIAVLFLFGFVSILAKSALGRFLLLIFFLGGGYVFYWKLTTGGF